MQIFPSSRTLDRLFVTSAFTTCKSSRRQLNTERSSYLPYVEIQPVRQQSCSPSPLLCTNRRVSSSSRTPSGLWLADLPWHNLVLKNAAGKVITRLRPKTIPAARLFGSRFTSVAPSHKRPRPLCTSRVQCFTFRCLLSDSYLALIPHPRLLRHHTFCHSPRNLIHSDTNAASRWQHETARSNANSTKTGEYVALICSTPAPAYRFASQSQSPDLPDVGSSRCTLRKRSRQDKVCDSHKDIDTLLALSANFYYRKQMLPMVSIRLPFQPRWRLPELRMLKDQTPLQLLPALSSYTSTARRVI